MRDSMRSGKFANARVATLAPEPAKCRARRLAEQTSAAHASLARLHSCRWLRSNTAGRHVSADALRFWATVHANPDSAFRPQPCIPSVWNSGLATPEH